MFTDNPELMRQMRILWGIEPHYMEFLKDRNKTIANAMEMLKEQDSISKDDYLIVLTNVHVDDQHVDSIQLRRVD